MLNISFPSILFTVINILVFAWIMKKLLFQRVMNVINERQKHIEDQFNEAKAKQDAADEKKAEYEKHLSNAKTEARAILDESRERAEKEHAKAVAETEHDIAEMKKKAASDLALEQEQAKKDLQSDISRLALQAARKIMTEGQKNEGTGN